MLEGSPGVHHLAQFNACPIGNTSNRVCILQVRATPGEVHCIARQYSRVSIEAIIKASLHSIIKSSSVEWTLFVVCERG